MKTLTFATNKMRQWHGSYSAAARAMNMDPRQLRDIRQQKKSRTPMSKLMLAHYKMIFLQKILYELRAHGPVRNWHINDAIKRVNRR